MNELRVPLIRDALSDCTFPTRPLRGRTILDVGCGGGILSEALARLGADVTGIDATAESVRVAELHWQSSHEKPSEAGCLRYSCTTTEDLLSSLAQPATFDAVVASEILEHVSNASAFVDTCCKLVKPNGSIFFTTLSRTYASYVLSIVAAEYLLKIVPQGTHEWSKYVFPDELEAMLRKNNFTTVLTHGMCYNVLTNRWHWSKNHSINYCLHAIKGDADNTRAADERCSTHA